jgi:hypothetical protein
MIQLTILALDFQAANDEIAAYLEEFVLDTLMAYDYHSIR